MVEMARKACSSGTESGGPTGQDWGGKVESSMEIVNIISHLLLWVPGVSLGYRSELQECYWREIFPFLK